MKVLFDHPNPFFLAHGGFQIQIEETKRALEKIDVTVEHLRWWDAQQSGDVIHFFGRPSGQYVDLAHSKRMPVVMAELLSGPGSRSSTALFMQCQLIAFARHALPRSFWTRMNWDAYGKADRVLALTKWEAELMHRLYAAPREKTVIVPNGVADEFVRMLEMKSERENYLVCTATITERKRVLELAEAAVRAKTPVWIIGKPYGETDVYAQRFATFVKKHPDVIRYRGAVEDRQSLAQIYRRARGFVLLSSMESLSLSALEAAACACPLLLSDLPWARSVFGDAASYCPITSTAETARRLHRFYDAAPSLPAPPRPLSWSNVARQLKSIYDEVLKTSP